MRPATQQRFALLGAFVPMFSSFGVRAAKEYGWIRSRSGAIAFAIAIGLFCIVGGYIAYRATQTQVRRDLEDMQSAGKMKR